MKTIQPKLHPELEALRGDYPILEKTTYLNSNSMGAMPSSVRKALSEYADRWQQDGAEAWEHWFEFLSKTADSAAKFIGAPKGQTVLNQNVAFFQAAVASSLELRGPRNKVVMDSLTFPNLAYVWDRYCEKGAQLELVPSEDGMTIPLEAWLDAIDERTALVNICHGIYISGALQDIQAICRKAHEVGAIVMVDAYQTIGVMPISVEEWEADIVVGGSHKWLCGGPGTAFMWIRPELSKKLRPKTTGWLAHADPFSFESAPIRYREDALRFLGGTPSMPAYYGAHAAFQTLHKIGTPTIREHNLALCDLIIELAHNQGLKVRSPLDEASRGAFVAIDFPNSQNASKRLIEEHFKLDWRPNCGLRLGPHFYNTEADIRRIMGRISEFATAN